MFVVIMTTDTFYKNIQIYKKKEYFQNITDENLLLTHSVAVTVSELERWDFPLIKLTETSRVLKENKETIN